MGKEATIELKANKLDEAGLNSSLEVAEAVVRMKVVRVTAQVAENAAEVEVVVDLSRGAEVL